MTIVLSILLALNITASSNTNHYLAIEGIYNSGYVVTADGEQWGVYDEQLINNNKYIIIFDTMETECIYDDEIILLINEIDGNREYIHEYHN